MVAALRFALLPARVHLVVPAAADSYLLDLRVSRLIIVLWQTVGALRFVHLLGRGQAHAAAIVAILLRAVLALLSIIVPLIMGAAHIIAHRQVQEYQFALVTPGSRHLVPHASRSIIVLHQMVDVVKYVPYPHLEPTRVPVTADMLLMLIRKVALV